MSSTEHQVGDRGSLRPIVFDEEPGGHSIEGDGLGIIWKG